MGAYIVKYKDVVRSQDGRIEKIICTADLESGNGAPSDGRKVKGTIHWVSADDCFRADVRIFDRLFTIENTGAIPEGETFDDYLNRDSVTVLPCCVMEKALESARAGRALPVRAHGLFLPRHEGYGRVQPHR